MTRQDNLVAQALLEKAIDVSPGYGQALSLLAACHTFAAHMGWEEMASSIDVAERAALAAIRADSEDAWAHYALASVYLFEKRFDDASLNSNWRWSSIRVSRRHVAFMVWPSLIGGAGRKVTAPHAKR